MKRVHFTIALFGALGASLSAIDHELVAGWDFSAYVAGVSSIDAATFAKTLDASYSEQDGAPLRGSAAAGAGTLYYDGSFGSTDADVDASAPPVDLQPTGPSLASNVDYDDFGERFDRVGLDSTFVNDQKLTLNFGFSSGSLVFSAASSGFTRFEMNLAAAANAGTAELQFLASGDGVTYTPVDTITVNTTDTRYSINFGGLAALNGVDGPVYFKITAPSIVQGGEVSIDNVAILALKDAATTWGGYDIVTNTDGSRWIDATSDWLGFLNVESAPFLYSFEAGVWLYLPEPDAAVPGAWAHVYKNGANTPVSGGWGGYPIVTNPDSSQWVDATANWLGNLSFADAPYIFSWELQSWMYFPEPAVEAPGAWIYVFKN
jgi:hypothetical protein